MQKRPLRKPANDEKTNRPPCHAKNGVYLIFESDALDALTRDLPPKDLGFCGDPTLTHSPEGSPQSFITDA